MWRFRNYSDWLVSPEMPTQQADHKIGQLSIAFEMLSPWLSTVGHTETNTLGERFPLVWLDTSCQIKETQWTKNPSLLAMGVSNTLANPMPNKRVYRERRQTLSVMMQTVGHTLSPGKTFSADPSYYTDRTGWPVEMAFSTISAAIFTPPVFCIAFCILRAFSR